MMEELPRESPPTPPRKRGMGGSEFIFYAALFECSLIGVALVLAWFGLFAPDQPLGRLEWREQLLPGLLWGALGTLPLMLLLLGFERLNFWPFTDLADVTEESIRPLFAQTALHELLLISLLAGLGEELLFRWSIQGGLAGLFGGEGGQLPALLLAAVLFGLCHYLNFAYAVVTFLVGLYFGWLMWWTGTWIAPAVAHASYDFLALLYLTRWPEESA